MSLTLCVCNCHNSETRGRRLLQRAGVTDYMGVPVYKGRQSVREYLDNNFDDSDVKVREMKAYIANRTKFTIIIDLNGLILAIICLIRFVLKRLHKCLHKISVYCKMKL